MLALENRVPLVRWEGGSVTGVGSFVTFDETKAAIFSI